MISRFGSISWRTLVECAIILTIAVSVGRNRWVKRFYALHAPVWGAHATVPPKTSTASSIVAGARAQIGDSYDAGYVQISYPGGDVASDRGACADVVVRALRHAGIDLQQLIHEDMAQDFEAYPHLNELTQPDSNIDHRRTLIQIRYFERHGMTLPNKVTPQTLEQWQPGDFVYWQMPGNRQHTGVLSDRINARSLPLVIQNGSVCIEEDCLSRWKIIGHFRFPKVSGMR